ncbi:hypothetical protein Ddye_015259 [Dipteronia dyeriana]|uniref:Peptidase metallopeptidase domain-containing protein n=1 Tax=Dipteronia dyeriana TaxID=168575 RepID=A0AAD9U5D4_9ROSI|nr:hypothetical protein Ddye_015259 [Dipteronia dyeriana]
MGTSLIRLGFLRYSMDSGNSGTRGDSMEPVAKAFRTWQGNTHFTFSRVTDTTNANIKIGFSSRDHGDGVPFDGPWPLGQVIAHAFAPIDGRFHYDADEQWAAGVSPGSNSFDLETVALHEIGVMYFSDPGKIHKENLKN